MSAVEQSYRDFNPCPYCRQIGCQGACKKKNWWERAKRKFAVPRLLALPLAAALILLPAFHTAEAQLRRVCQRNVYGAVACWVVSNEGYTYGRRAVTGAYNFINRPYTATYVAPRGQQCGYYATDNGWGRITYQRICR